MASLKTASINFAFRSHFFSTISFVQNNHHMLFKRSCSVKSTRQNISSAADEFSSNQLRNIERLFEGIKNGERSCLAESITLIESSHKGKRAMGQELVRRLQENSKKNNPLNKRTNETSFRIGLSGSPGAGKSTFIETLGSFLLQEKKHKLAVLAIDPSSSTRGGSLLGDKTRMTMLSRNSNAYIRPSPTLGKLGGVTRSTNEAILLCEAAGYDIIFVETVGVGQSEHTVADMVDMFVLLIPPASGDELQGLKRGIVELSDLILVNKADGDLLPAARRVCSEYISALKFIQPHLRSWKPQVKQISSLTSEGIPEAWQVMEAFRNKMLETGELEERRQEQLKKWMLNYIADNILTMFKNHSFVKDNYKTYEQEVINGTMTPGYAADKLLQYFFK